MDMDQAAVFLAGSILFVMGCLVILIGILVANNLVAKHWKSWGWSWFTLYPDRPSPRFATAEELEKIAPTMDPVNKDTDNKTTNK